MMMMVMTSIDESDDENENKDHDGKAWDIYQPVTCYQRYQAGMFFNDDDDDVDNDDDDNGSAKITWFEDHVRRKERVISSECQHRKG